MKPKRGTGQVHHESEAVSELAEAMAEELGQQAAPGAYLSGKRLVGTQAKGVDQMMLQFEGGWSLLITGVFKLTLTENRKGPEHSAPKHDIEAEVIEEEDLIDEGNRLMEGEQA